MYSNARISIFFAIVLTGCTSSTPSTSPTSSTAAPTAPATTVVTSARAGGMKKVDGQSVNIVGLAAEIPDHADKYNGVGVVVGPDKLLFAGDFRPVPAQLLGTRIRVTGTLRQKRLPMFHSDPDGGLSVQGIPVPPGTDIEKESIYYVVENPIWKPVTD